MPFYMTQFAYTAEAIAAMAKNPQDRSIPVRELAQKLGGRLIGFYFCFGEYGGILLLGSCHVHFPSSLLEQHSKRAELSESLDEVF